MSHLKNKLKRECKHKTPSMPSMLAYPMYAINFCITSGHNSSTFQKSNLGIETIAQIKLALDQNVQDAFGNTILHFIAKTKGSDTVAGLLQRALGAMDTPPHKK